MEKIVHPRPYSFLQKNSLLSEQKYYFNNKLFTNHALINITTSKIQTACDKGIFACCVYMLTSKKPLILLIMGFYLIN